ncbi:hypothetical protein HZB96_05105, partial [Candidatus Gottesmanbacteria bacterium]|nr:hypothetical protein [Candidatus Gottesmanbacteria bacterium]
MSTTLSPTAVPVNPTPTLESEPLAPVTPKRREPFKPNVNVSRFVDGPLPSEDVATHAQQLQEPS